MNQDLDPGNMRIRIPNTEFLGQCDVRIDERDVVFRKADERREDCSRLQGSGRLRTPSRPCTQVTALDR
jgi:hypothetical protein